MKKDGVQGFSVFDSDVNASISVIALHWIDAADIYAQIHGLSGYRQWLQKGHPQLTVFEQAGPVQSNRRCL